MAENTEQPIVGDNMYCAHCGTENVKSGHACVRCGERLIQVTTESSPPSGLVSCARCGGANNTQAVYCWVCGSEMNDAVRISPTARPEGRPEGRLQTPVQSQPKSPPKSREPRTYRPDLNPVSTPTTANKSPRDSIGEQGDLRGPGPQGQPEIHDQHDVDIQQPESPFGAPDGEAAENTSGIRDGEIPAGVKRWNWAAFLMPAVWGLFSGVPYTAILFGAAFLPSGYQLFVMVSASLYLGFKGNELSWRGKKWRSVEHFNAFQKQWTSWAVKLTIAVGAILIFYLMSRGGG
ncbi:MAG: hypothetical protein V3T49_00065 [Dehalococcoidia bacterium]